MLDVRELISELIRQRENSLDIVVPTNSMHAHPLALREGHQEVVIDMPAGEDKMITVPATRYAHGQIAEKCGIPMKYYDKCLDTAGGEQILADQVNFWMPKKERRLVRILDGQMRALLSDQYRIIDNYDVVFSALDQFSKFDLDIHQCELTETRMYIKAYLPHKETIVRAGGQDLQIYPGLVLSNSEVGASRVRVEPSLLNVGCKNIFIAGAQFKATHLGSRLDEGIRWKDDTLKASDEALFKQIRDTIDTAFSPQVITETISRLTTGVTNAIDSPTLAVRAIGGVYNISEDRREKLLDLFSKEPSKTQFGLANAFSEFAHTITEDQDDVVDFERNAYEIAALPPEKFNKILAAEAKQVEIAEIMVR